LAVSRAVVFLTDQCNMACGYCKSTGRAGPQWQPAHVLALLDELADTGTRHVHWTGGEPSLHPGFAALVRHSARRGMDNSVSTNGTGTADSYLGLARAGMGRFYVSVDAPDPVRFDEITRSRGHLPDVLETLGALCDWRDRGNRLHVTVNTVLTRGLVRHLLSEDGARLRRVLGWLRSSGADDFKFLPASAEPATEHFVDADERTRFVEICSEEIPKHFRMFHYRLRTIGNGGHGLTDARCRRCFLSLDDRAYDAAGAYPCVIQLREGGRSLYEHRDAPERQRQRVLAFACEDRTLDPICRAFCFDLYRDLNARVDQLLRDSAVRGI
jgi:MoaA/NifB/PqqE/SkfB family radical SAM enzyme